MTTVCLARTPSQFREWLGSYWLTLCIAVAALLLQARGHLNCDVSWFITVAEKYLDGAIPYVDVTDPNPPFAFLSLLPPTFIARILGVASEPIIVIYVFLLAFASILVCAAVLSANATYTSLEKRILLNSAVFLFLVTPGFMFGQREQLAIYLMAPMFMLIVTKSEGGQPSRALRIFVGALAGLAIGFKPIYIFPLAAPIVDMSWRQRSIASLFSAENLSLVAGAIMQFLIILIFFPGYLHDQLPGLAQVYIRIRIPWTDLLLRGPCAFSLILLAILPLAMKWRAAPEKDGRMPIAARVCSLGAVGFMLTFFVQGKGWINHAYPAIVLTFFAWIFAMLDTRPGISTEKTRLLVGLILAPTLAFAPLLFFAHANLLRLEEFPGLRDAVTKLSPPHPRVIALANQLVIGHPLSQQIGGVWVGRASALWLAHSATVLLDQGVEPEMREKLESYIHQDLMMLAEDVRLKQPDVILVESEALRLYAETRGETRGLLSGYDRAGKIDEIEIWRRISN